MDTLPPFGPPPGSPSGCADDGAPAAARDGLVRLLTASFAAWGLTAHARHGGGAARGAEETGAEGEMRPAGRAVWARIALADGREELALERAPRGGGSAPRGLPCWWLCEPATGAVVAEAPSIGALLKALRRRLDPSFRPGRALIGVRPMAPEGVSAEAARR